MNQQRTPKNNNKRQSKHNMNHQTINFDNQLSQDIFLRDDVNHLFQKMMVDADFNLKNYNKKRHQQFKQNKRTQNLPNFLNKKKNYKNLTQPQQIIQQNESFLQKSNRFETQKQQQRPNKNNPKMNNFNKLLKKKDTIVSSQLNQKRSVDLSKTTNNFRQYSMNQSNKNQQKQTLFSSTKYDQFSSGNKSNNLRKKIMSMTTKGKNHKFQRQKTQNLHESKTTTINFYKASQQINKQKQKTDQEEQKVENKGKNKYNQLQKKYNKGGRLKFKHVQNWLNNIIQQYCHDEYFDSSLTSAALKKYYIDSNSLMSNGVDPNDVNRIYNSLFVYSIGFNNLIKQISKGNKQLVKNIWKVFSLLLQYCAAGNYETVVGQIQRDKLRKVQQLKMQIQRRQEIIQKNQQINQQKNMSMYKQLKRLKDQNINLANQRQILMEDFQQADQAFNQEVSLRLKFQNTINQIYGIHKELSNKHGRLFHDFQQKIQQLRKASQKYFNQTKVTEKYKFQLIELREKYNELLKINNHDKQHIDVLLIELTKMKQSYFQAIKQLQKSKNLNTQKQRKLQQFQIQLKNNKIILQLREKSAKQTHAQYRITLQQNNKLFMVISQQRQEMEVLLKQKKQFNQNVLKILADTSYYKKKLQGTQNVIKQLKEKVTNSQMSLHKSQVQNQIYIKEAQGLRKDLQSNYQNIKKMHLKNFELQEELTFLRKYQGNMDVVLEQKNSTIQQLKNKVEDLYKRLSQEIHEYKSLQSKYKILQIQFRAQKQANYKKVEDYKKQQQKMTSFQTSLSKLLTTTQVELQKFKNLFNNTLMDLKNQKFQRGNLSLNYEQILKVMQKKNAQQKQMAIKINQLQEEVNEYKQKYKLTHLNLVNTTEDLTNKINNLKNIIENQQQMIDKKVHHYHPMLYEDLYHRYQRQIQNHQNTDTLLGEQRRKLFQQRNQFQKQIKKIKNDNQFQQEKIQKQTKKQMQKLNEQIQYLKQQNKKIKQKLNSLQILQMTYKQKVKHFEQKQSDQMQYERLKRQLQEKNVKIQQLYGEIQRIHDLKRDQIGILEKKIKQVEEDKMNFVYQFKTKKQRQMRQELQKSYSQQLQKFKEQYRSNASRNSRLSPQNLRSKLNSGNQNQQQNQQMEQYFKQLIRNKTLDEILSIKKQQFQSLSQIQNKNFFDQIQTFFKKEMSKSNNQLFNRSNFFFSKNGTQNNFNKTGTKFSKQKVPNYLQKIQNSSQDIKKRSSISRKLKNAFQYYGKQTKLPK